MEKIDTRQRLLLVIALSFAFITVLQMMFGKPPEPSAALSADGGTVVAMADGGTPPTAALLPTEPSMAGDGGAQVVAQNEPPREQVPLKELERTRSDMVLRFSNEGASVKSAVLTGKRERQQPQISIVDGFRKLFGAAMPPPAQMDLSEPPPSQPMFGLTIEGSAPVAASTRYEVVEESERAVAFRARQGPWEILKRFEWDAAGYGLSMKVNVTNTSSAPQTGELGLLTARQIDPKTEQKSSLFGGIGNEASVGCKVGETYEKLTPAGKSQGFLSCGAEAEHTVEQKGPLQFVDIDQQYFLAALYPMQGATEGRCVVTALPTSREASLHFPMNIAAGQTASWSFGAFLGPKDLELLKATNAGLEKTIDLGLWAVICKLLLTVLQFFHKLIGNWGVAIILLTVSVKILLLPLTHKAMVSAEGMKKLQPKMEEIKKKFPDDRERQNVEVMKLYQEAKVNPLGGCLPLLLQLPIWAALFTTLRTSYDLYGEPFVGPVWTDLTHKDPTYLLPFALGVTMIITQRLQPQMMDKQQAFIFTWIMPVFFTAMMMNYPAGLSLYIFTNNLLSILQQFLLRKYLEKKGIAAPRSKGPPPPGDKRLKESAS